MVTQVSQQMADTIAATLNYPDLGDSGPGTYAVYENHRYLLAHRNGKYLAWDISVYADDGTLLTDSMDVWISELSDLGQDVVQGTMGYFNALLIGAAVFAAVYLFGGKRK